MVVWRRARSFLLFREFSGVGRSFVLLGLLYRCGGGWECDGDPRERHRGVRRQRQMVIRDRSGNEVVVPSGPAGAPVLSFPCLLPAWPSSLFCLFSPSPRPLSSFSSLLPSSSFPPPTTPLPQPPNPHTTPHVTLRNSTTPLTVFPLSTNHRKQ